jgi:hypothetical protein
MKLSYGDTKQDRNGRIIYFVGYTKECDKKGNLIELWEPDQVFKRRAI